MKGASSSAASERTVARTKLTPHQSHLHKSAPLDSVGDIRAHVEQRTHQPLHLAPEQEEVAHSAPVWHGEVFAIRDPLV
jgi:hypothetical protein